MSSDNGLVHLMSPRSVIDTMSLLESVVLGKRLRIMARIDHSEETLPSLTFKSRSISLVRAGELAVEGDLTIRGVTRNVVFEVEGPTPPPKDPWQSPRRGISNHQNQLRARE
jgi:hypothetical protein